MNRKLAAAALTVATVLFGLQVPANAAGGSRYAPHIDKIGITPYAQ
ncbi:hypothetical protein ACTMTJ_27540 [Phytohabitans sp. LJ34]